MESCEGGFLDYRNDRNKEGWDVRKQEVRKTERCRLARVFLVVVPCSARRSNTAREQRRRRPDMCWLIPEKRVGRSRSRVVQPIEAVGDHLHEPVRRRKSEEIGDLAR